MSGNLRLAVDVGGTFTDLVLHDGGTGAIATGKLLTTPADPSIAIIDGTRRLLKKHGKSPADLDLFIHATTLVTNTLIERKGAVTGFIMTRGFRDIIEMGTETRYDIYDLGIDLPPPLVARAMRREVTERMDAAGAVLTPLEPAEVRTVVRGLVDDGATAIAVCLLHSYINPRHEQEIGELIRREFPRIAVSLSSEVQPEIREFERASTTVANAYAQPVTAHHLDSLTRGLSGLGFGGRFHIMLSSGGLTNGATISIFSGRSRFPPKGMNGGEPGAGTEIMINGQPAPLKGSVRVKQNDVLTVCSPGGGGFGAARN